MKKFILFLIAIFCISGFTSTIEAKSNQYNQYQKMYKKNTYKIQKKYYKYAKCISAKNFGKFRSKITGKIYTGHQSLSYINTRKKKHY